MEIQISQDIRKYKTKDVGNFSFKEAGFIALAIGAGVLTYKLSGSESVDTAVVPMAVILIIGFVRPYGMSFIQFMRTIFVEQMMSPRVYYNQTDFEYEPDKFEELYGEPIHIPSGWNDKDVGTDFKLPKEDLKELIP